MSEKSYEEKAIYLNTAELIVLLQGQEINDVVVFEELANVKLSNREVAMACAALIRKGLLETDEREIFLLREDLKPMFGLVRQSRLSCILYGQLMCIPMQIIYFYQDAVVVLQQDELRVEYYRLSYLPIREFLGQITSYEFLEQDDRLEPELLYPEDEVLEKLQGDLAVEKDENILLFLQFYQGRKHWGDLMVYQFPLQDIIVWKSGTNKGCIAYTKENLEKKVLEMNNGYC